jgi:hypothetical protein
MVARRRQRHTRCSSQVQGQLLGEHCEVRREQPNSQAIQPAMEPQPESVPVHGAVGGGRGVKAARAHRGISLDILDQNRQ